MEWRWWAGPRPIRVGARSRGTTLAATWCSSASSSGLGVSHARGCGRQCPHRSIASSFFFSLPRSDLPNGCCRKLRSPGLCQGSDLEGLIGLHSWDKTEQMIRTPQRNETNLICQRRTRSNLKTSTADLKTIWEKNNL
jgi:hypothetical protein